MAGMNIIKNTTDELPSDVYSTICSRKFHHRRDVRTLQKPISKMAWAQYPPREKPAPRTEEEDSLSDYSVETSLTTTDQRGAGEAPPAKLSWRMDPIENFSDWKIEIRVCNNKNECSMIDTYHVHHTALAFGSRRSRYFVNLFHCRVDGSVTQIELSDKAATYFPDFL
jgi:hypothetical protein